MAETHLSHKADIMARCMTQVHTKEVRRRVDVFQVAPSVPVVSPYICISILCQAAHRARPRSGIVLLIHIRLPGPPPSHLSAPAISEHGRGWSTSLSWDPKPYQRKEKIKPSHHAEDNGRQKFQANLPQPAFGTTSVHNSKLPRWCLQNMMSLHT